MAQMTPEEFIEALESVTEALRNNKAANQQQAEGLLKSIGINKAHADEILKAGKQFGSSAATMAKGMYKGQTSAESMASAVDTVTTGLEVLIALIPGFRLLKIGIMLAAKAFGGLTKAATEQAQAEFKAYQQLNQIGAAGAEGLQGVFDTVQKFGYNVNELDKMVALVAANSESLAQFGGLASKGTTAFADAMNQLTHGQTGAELGALGKNLEDINGAGAAYIKMQTMLGRTQQQVGYDLAGKTKQYIMDLDRLQRLTGTSADALQKQQQEALQDSAYAAYMDQLETSGAAGEAQAKKIKDVLAVLTPEMQALARRGIGGDVGAAAQLNQIAPSLIKNLRDSGSTFEGTVESVNTDLKNFTGRFRESYQINAEGMNEFGTKFVNLTENTARTNAIRQRIEEVGIEQARAGLQADVKNMATAEVLNRQNTANLQNFIQNGVGLATTALEKLAKAANMASGAIPGSKGVTTGAGAPGAATGTSKGVTTGAGAPGAATGTLAGVNAQLADAVSKATAEYKQVTGKTAIITSGVREREKQERMYNEYIAGGKKGKPVAPPGTSKHETGNAVDINQADADAMARMGILQKYGLNRPVANDPVHIELAKTSGPNKNYLEGPDKNRLKSIEGFAERLDKISKEQKNFTATDAKAYGAGPNNKEDTKIASNVSGPNNKEDTKIASNVSGPNNKYDAKIVNPSPASTLPPSYDSARARYAAQNDRSEELLASWNEKADEQTRIARAAVDELRGIKREVRG
jgi:hypothetical protein